MTVLLTGADGYLGWPTALRLADRLDQRIVGVDNLARREWVDDAGSVPAVPIDDPETRFDAAPNLSFVQADLADRDAVDKLLSVHEPDTVLHLAAQPSAPYSQINGERALYTQQNNMAMNVNLLWGLRENDLADTHYVETTTTGIYGAPYFPIPEGGVHVERKGGEDAIPFPAMGGSWYHQSRAYSGGNLRLADTQWSQPISEVRTAIVYGSETDETVETGHPTRFDFDYYFGTVVNRFCAQAVAGYPLTVYGKGEQRKPMVSLEDAVESLVRLTERGHGGDGLEIFNQVTRPVAIVELAETIAEVGDEFGLDADVEHFENPRDEDEEHQMEMENERFLDLVGGQRRTLEEGVRDILGTLVEYDGRIEAFEDRFLPGVLTE